MDDSKNLFISEAEEMLTLMNNSLVSLEKNPEDKDLLNEIFRSAHTIKGMAGCEGLTEIQELSHAIEDILRKLRDGEVKLSSGFMDVLFSSTDKLESLVKAVKEGCPLENVSPIVETLKTQKFSDVSTEDSKVEEGEEGEEGEKSEEGEVGAERRTHLRLEDLDRKEIDEGQEEGFIAYELLITMKKDSVMMEPRVLVIVKNLQKKGKVVNHQRITKEILSGKYGRHFGMFFMTNISPEEIKADIEQISDVEHVRLFPVIVDDVLLPKKLSQGEKKKSESKKEEKVVSNAREIQTIRVDVAKLDKLMNLIGELSISKIRLNDVVEDTASAQVKEVVSGIDRLTQDLQNIATSMRLVPMDSVFNRFQRMVRDSAREAGKEVNFEIFGKEIELDRSILNGIVDPLVHLLRNAVAHGIEAPIQRTQMGKDALGQLKLSARREKSKVIIEVSDDGGGLVPEKIRSVAKQKKIMPDEEIDQLNDKQAIWLITRPGFSTVQEADGLSGRGVGMDVVKSMAESFGGRLDIESEVGCGSTFTFELPLSLSIIKALLVDVSGQKFAIPLTSIVETIRLKTEMIRQMKDKEIFNLRGEVLPVVYIDKIFNIQAVPGVSSGKGQIVCIVEIGFEKIALAVDSLIGQQDVVVKVLPKYGGATKGLSGVTILSDGQPCLILDVAGLV